MSATPSTARAEGMAMYPVRADRDGRAAEELQRTPKNDIYHMRELGLDLSAEKTVAFVYATKAPTFRPKLHIDGREKPCEQKVTYLGPVIDRRLNWGGSGVMCNPQHAASHQHPAVARGQHLRGVPKHDAPTPSGTSAVCAFIRATAARPHHLPDEPRGNPEDRPAHLPGDIQVGDVDPDVHGGRSQHHRQPPPEARAWPPHPHNHL